MRRDDPVIRLLEDPDPNAFPDTVPEFVRALEGPTAMLLPGRDRSRCRAVVTLLHGNEPSGTIGLHHWLKNYRQPAVDILCVFGAVHAALHEELFRHRFIPGERDQNRCFLPPFRDDRPGRIAKALLELLDRFRPECLIDIHNTSGRSASFGVVTHEDPDHETLVAMFTNRLMITDIRIGGLMEISGQRFPAVTVECGGARESASHQVAIRGLARYLFQERLTQPPEQAVQMDVYNHPVRLELQPDCRLAYADRPQPDTDLTVPTDIENLNFGVVGPDRPLAWLGAHGMARLRVRDSSGRNQIERFFRNRSGRLHAAMPLKLFMVTTNPTIARSDCLFYAALESGHRIVAVG
jgi:hypothetical protein